MNENPQNNNNRAVRVATIAAFVPFLVYPFVVQMPGIIINEIVYAFSLDGANEGLIATLTSLGFMISLFLVIFVQGRAQKIFILLIATAVQAVALFISGISPTFLLLCFGSVLVGFSGGFIDSGCNSAIVDARKNDSTRYLGYLHGFFGVGSFLSPLVILWALRYTDWRGVHYALAIVSMLVVLLIFLVRQGAAGERNTPTVREHLFTKEDLLTHLRIERNVFLTLAGFFAMFTVAAAMVWVVRYMTLLYNAEEIGMLSISVYWVCATINRFFLSRIIKLPPMTLFIFGAFLSGVFVLFGVLSGNPIVFCMMMGALGLCSGQFIPVLVSEFAKGYEGKTTFTTSILMFVMGAARIAAPVTMAFFGTQISLNIGMMLPAVAAFATGVCGWCAIRCTRAIS